jgi:hypothetical protein
MVLKKVMSSPSQKHPTANLEIDIAKAQEASRQVQQLIESEFAFEGMLIGKVLHAITTLAMETTLPPETTKQWTQAVTRAELPKFTGVELAVEVAKCQENMGRTLRAVIFEKKAQSQKLVQDGKDEESKEREKLVLAHQYPNACGQDFGLPSPQSTHSSSPSISSVSFSTVTTVCDNCHKRGHDMGECWEFDPEEKKKALKTLKKHQCNRCKKYGHHENSCWEAFPEKRATAMQWTAQRNAQRG